ncbi:MAG: hypothetical protein JG770_1525 [Mahella sp.]|nr:hypothetical protein [Mahella sp.]
MNMKFMIKTLMYFIFFIFVTQILPKMMNPSNDYDILQILFLLIISFGISFRDKIKKEKGSDSNGK